MNHSAVTGTVTSSWVGDRFGIDVTPAEPAGRRHIDDLIVLGLRRNRRRAHLLVSTVLGKHIPTAPSVVRAAADELGDAVVAAIGEQTAARSTVVGFAETATGLGHCVAERISARLYLHSTRRRTGTAVHGTFEEGHSHATTHLLQPSSPELLALDVDAPLILVDDEISTGSTAIRAITALEALAPRAHYVVASLVDMRTAEHRAAVAAAAVQLQVRIDHVSLAEAAITLPPNIVDEVWALEPTPLNPLGERGAIDFVDLPWPADVPDGGRHGFTTAHRAGFDAALTDALDRVRASIDPDRAVVVVGHEELMYLPLRLAEALEESGIATRYQTTTRSPAHVHDVDGYPLRRGFTFTAPESDPGTPRFVYNLIPPDQTEAPTEGAPQVLLVIDAPADTDLLRQPGGVLDVLSAAGHDVCVAVLPTGGSSR